MLDYDFAKLNDKEFEAFCIDLLSEYLGCYIERFKPGKDLGIDGRFFAPTGNQAIVQCKHWAGSDVKALVRFLKTSEAIKLSKLKPLRYILTTSLPLSASNKDKIQNALSPWIKSAADIFGKDDLNNILAKHPVVEERHHKLWFTSVNVMMRLQNTSIKGRSEFKLNEAKNFAARYVITASHAAALEKLHSLRTIIITGEPGIGKSTLAEQIALQYALKDFELCCIAESISEAEGIWKDNSPQLFYFDDFLGRNYLLALENNKDAHIVGFIKRVRNDLSKRFILTSRTNVFNQGKSLTDLFRVENLNRNEYELRVDSLTLLDKARILYSHMWNSKLTTGHVDQIYSDEHYLKISQHRNYNPRLISFITDFDKLAGIPSEEYWAYINETLENPKDIWSHVFDNQLGVPGRALVRLAVFNGHDIEETTLGDAFHRYIAENSATHEASDQFGHSLAMCVGSVLNRTLSQNSALFTLFNPSIGDYVVNRYKQTPDEIVSCLSALQTISSLKNLRALLSNGILKEKVFIQITTALVQRLILNVNVDMRYRFNLADLHLSRSTTSKIPQELAGFIDLLFQDASESECCGVQAEVLYYAILFDILDCDSLQTIAKIRGLFDDNPSEEEFRSISKLISVLSADRIAEIEDEFSTLYLESLSENLRDMLWESGTLDDYRSMEEREEAEASLKKYLKGKLDEIYIPIAEERLDPIYDSCDVEEIIQKNSERNLDPFDEPSGGGGGKAGANDEIAAVRDLFQRS